ncbi:MAG: TerB family tellurite resistance protein [Cycloclasticus sp.]
MDFDILGIINDATAEANAFEHHPAADFSMEEQLLYLNGLALVMNADGDIDAREVEYLRILIKSMNLDQTILDDMTAFAQKPDKDTVQAFFLAFRRKPVAQLFLFDALMMSRRDEQVHEREKAVIDKIAEQLEILKGTQQDVFDLFCHIRHKNWQESALYFSSHLLNPEHFKHLLSYHGVDHDELMAETEALRAERLQQLLQSKISSALNSKASGKSLKEISDADFKTLLGHDLVIPMLQSELDRNQANVTDGKYRFNTDEYTDDITLADEGIGWNVEAYSLYSLAENSEMELFTDSKAIAYLLKKFSVGLNSNVAYYGDAKSGLPVGTFSKNLEVIDLSCCLLKDFPYLIVNDELYRYYEGEKSSYNTQKLYVKKYEKISQSMTTVEYMLMTRRVSPDETDALIERLAAHEDRTYKIYLDETTTVPAGFITIVDKNDIKHKVRSLNIYLKSTNN